MNNWTFNAKGVWDDKYRIPGLKGERQSKTKIDGEEVTKYVSNETKYSGWLRRQPKEFQEEVLGKERAKLFRENKVKLENFVDERGATIKLKDLLDKDGEPII